MKRPEPGTVYRETVKFRMCGVCGCSVDDTGLCGSQCSEDGEIRTSENTFWAVYERVDTFVGDEVYQ